MKRILFVLLCSSLVSKAQVPTYVPVNGLAAWYSFDGNANDQSGNGHDGTVQNAMLCPDRFNQSSSAYYFGGSNQQIICSNDTSLTNHTDFSVSAWFSVDNRATGWQQNVIISNIGVFNASGGFEIFTSNPPNADITGMFRPATFADQNLQTTGIVDIDSAQWNHVVYTLHYITVEDSTQASIYLNGSFIKSQKFFHAINYSGITPLIIGVNIDSLCCQRSFKGKIDDIGIWNVALTQQQITNLYLGPTLGLNAQASESSVQVYPNPATNEININFVNAGNEVAGLILYNSIGSIVKNFSFSKSELNFSVADLPEGIYFLKAIDRKKILTVKIIVINKI